jgi:hypothetical protein
MIALDATAALCQIVFTGNQADLMRENMTATIKRFPRTDRIDAITPEMEAMLPSFVDYGLRIGLSTERSDREAGTAAIKAHYQACGLNEPDVVWFDSPYASVRASVRASVGASVGDSVRASVRDSVWASVWASVRASVRDSVWASVWASVGAHYDADDCAWFMAWDTYGLSLSPTAVTMMRVSENVWWWYPGKDVVYASDRPVFIKRDDDGRLHSEQGHAFQFADGKGFSSWHGQAIPDEWVAGKPPSPRDALRWQNMDQRAAACEIVGWHNIIDQLNGKVIDDSGHPKWGRLIEVDLPDSGRERFLDAICGTGRRFSLPVPPQTCTVDEAQSVLHGGLPASVLRLAADERT